MKKIFKYPLAAKYVDGSGAGWEPRQLIEMPCGAQILSVGIQSGSPFLWALVNPEAPVDRRDIYIVATGRELPDEFNSRKFLGTLIFGNGGIVLHVFE